MRSIYSELFVKPSLIVLMSASLLSCSDNAFKSAVFSDPAREAHAKNEKTEDASGTKSGRRAEWEAKLKNKEKAPAAPATPTTPATPPVVANDPTITPVAETTTTATDDFTTRRSQARARSKTLPPKKPTAPVVDKTRQAEKSSKRADTVKFTFVTESVDGTNSAGVIKSLTGLARISADSTLNLETLNMGSLTLELSPRSDIKDRFDALASLELIVHVDSDADSTELRKTMPLRNLGNIKKTESGTYEGLLRINERIVRIKLQKPEKGARSGELILIQENGDERKVLSLIEEK